VGGVALLLGTAALAGCNMTAGLVSSPRTPIEQLVLTQSLLRSLEDMALPLRPGDSVAIETAWIPTHDDFKGDLPFAQSVVAAWLTRQGAVVNADEPRFHVRVLLHAFGLDKRDVFFGIPPIQSVLLPIALPELTLYRNERNRGYTRISIDVVEGMSGRLVGTPSVTEAAVIHERYTLLFLLSWQSSDLLPPPRSLQR
jgi:hypothetical protein